MNTSVLSMNQKARSIDQMLNSQRVTSKTTVPPGVHVQMSRVCDVARVVCSGKELHHQTEAAVCWCHGVDPESRNFVSSGVDVSSQMPKARNSCMDCGGLHESSDWNCLRLSVYLIFSKKTASELPSVVTSDVNKWMNVVKENKWLGNERYTTYSCFFTILKQFFFPLSCRCLLWKLRHESTLKHVLDKEPLIYRTTERRQVGHWTMKRMTVILPYTSVQTGWQIGKMSCKVSTSFDLVGQNWP